METAFELADLYEFSTTSGIVVPKVEVVKTKIEQMFLDVFGSDLDLSVETPVGRLIEALTVMFRTTLGVNAQNANQFNVSTASGIYLDSLAQIYGMSRSLEQRTQVGITVTTSGAGVTIPAGSLISNTVTRSVFRIIDDIVVPPNETIGRGFAEAVNAGPEPAEEGDISRINTSTLGWVSVTNSAAISLGRYVETDEQFRQRLVDSRPIGMAFLQSIYSRVSRVEGVSSCVIYENNGASTILKNGVAIGGHSIYVCVQGGEKEDIAKAIADTKTPGTGMTNYRISGMDEIEPILVHYSSRGVDLDVYFYRPELATIYVHVDIDASQYTGVDVEGYIKSVIEKFMSGVGIGERISAAEISRAISSEITTVTPLNVSISLDSPTSTGWVGKPYIQLAGYQIGGYSRDAVVINFV